MELPSLPVAQADRLRNPPTRRPHLLVAADQAGAVHQFFPLLEAEDYVINTVFEAGDALARVLREESRHHLLVTGSAERLSPPVVPAPELVVHLREIGYRGCIHLRSGFIAPEELNVYQQAGIGYVLSPVVAGTSFLDDVQLLTAAAPAGAACLSILQLDA